MNRSRSISAPSDRHERRAMFAVVAFLVTLYFAASAMLGLAISLGWYVA